MNDASMTFWSHLEELRKRLIICLASVGIGFGLCFHFAEKIFSWLMIPYQNAYHKVFAKEPTMITTGLVESFMVYMKLALLAGVFLSSPIIIAQIWGFVSPALRPSERKWAIPTISLASLFFIGGALLGYFMVFPVGFQYFLELNQGGNIQPLIRMQEYFELSSLMLLIFGTIFEAPLLVIFLMIIGIMDVGHLIRPWRGIIVGISIAAAVFSPPDPGSMIMVGIPMLLLYLLTILVGFLIGRRRKAQN